MKVYKILHKPTGLFFKPSKGSGNLSKKGKIYPMKPSLTWIGPLIKIDFWNRLRITKENQIMLDYFKLETPIEWHHFQRYVEVPQNDWEIIEIE
jgi:hypothetical protein